MVFLIFFLCCLFLLFFPKIFVFIYLCIRYSSNSNPYLQIFDTFIFVYLGLCVSVMLADRPYYVGGEIGFGQDMLHYYNAFDWVASVSWSTFFYDFSYITSLTGSAEPVFWIVVKIITIFSDQGYYIHISLTFLGCLLIFISGQIWNKAGLLFVFLYTNTITFFAFQGSAIRSGLAFSVAILGYVLFLKNKYKYINFLAPFIHFSMIPMPLTAYFGKADYKNPRSILFLFLVSVCFIVLLFYFSAKSMDGGLGAKLSARLSENELDINSLIQFLFESVFTLFLSFFVFRLKIEKTIRVSFLSFFILALVILVVSPTAFARFYRYEYLFIILIFSSILLASNWKVKLFILLVSISWFVFIGFDRYVGVFSENWFDFLNFNLVYRF